MQDALLDVVKSQCLHLDDLIACGKISLNEAWQVVGCFAGDHDEPTNEVEEFLFDWYDNHKQKERNIWLISSLVDSQSCF